MVHQQFNEQGKKSKLLNKTTRIILEVIGGILAALVIMAAVLAWRLSQGPIPINFLNSELEQSLASSTNAYQVDVGETMLVWNKQDRTVNLRSSNFKLLRPDQTELAVLNEIVLRLRAVDLLKGHIAPTEMRILNPRLEITRQEKTFAVDIADKSQADDVTASTHLKDVMAWLSDELLNNPNLKNLETLALNGGEITIHDKDHNRDWWFPNADIMITKSGRQINAKAQAEIALNDDRATITADVNWHTQKEQTEIQINFNQLDVRPFLSLIPTQEKWGEVNLRVNGQAELVVEKSKVTKAMIKVDGQQGSLSIPEIWQKTVPMQDFLFIAKYDPDQQIITIEDAMVQFDGPIFSAQGVLREQDGKTAMDLNVKGQNIPMNSLPTYWPDQLALNPRNWVTQHLSNGIVTQANMKLKLHTTDTDPVIEQINGTMQFTGITVDYLAPLPPVANTSGHVKFDDKIFDIVLESGDLKDIQLQQGVVNIWGLQENEQYIDIHLGLKGPLRTAIEVIDSEPLKFASKKDIYPQEVVGDMTGQLFFHFPLSNDLLMENMDIKMAADIQNARIENAWEDRALENATLALNINQKEMMITGTGTIEGVTGQIKWLENFDTKNSPLRSQYHVQTTLNDKQQKTFGVPENTIVTGPVGVNLTYETNENQPAQLKAALDFKQAALQFPVLGEQKKPGVAANGEVDVRFVDGHVQKIESFRIHGDHINIQGRASFKNKGKNIDVINIPRFDLHKTKSKITVKPLPKTGYALNITGSYLDVSNIWNRAVEKDTNQEKSGNIVTTINVDKLDFGGTIPVTTADVQIHLDKDQIQSLKFSGNAGADNPINAIFIDDKKIKATGKNAGDILRALNLYDNMDGGTLLVTGEFADDNLFDSQLTIKDYKIKKAPILAKIISLTSITNIPEILAGKKSMAFNELIAKFTYQGGKVYIEKARAFGPSLGLSVQGNLDLTQDKLEMDGTIVPAVLLNEIIGGIPLVGDLLTAGGEGLIAFVFNLEGNIDDPKVSVNPLSGITPGFLRGIYKGDAQNVPDQRLEEPKKQEMKKEEIPALITPTIPLPTPTQPKQ